MLRECEQWALRRYNEARERGGIAPVEDKQGLRKYWRRLALWALEGNVKLAEYFDWSKGHAKWQKGAFPSPASAAGQWLRGEWDSRDRTAEAAGHAGKTYRVGSVRERLAAAGFELDEDSSRYVRAEAELERLHPHLRAKADDDAIEGAIVWLAANGEG